MYVVNTSNVRNLKENSIEAMIFHFWIRHISNIAIRLLACPVHNTIVNVLRFTNTRINVMEFLK